MSGSRRDDPTLGVCSRASFRPVAGGLVVSWLEPCGRTEAAPATPRVARPAGGHCERRGCGPAPRGASRPFEAPRGCSRRTHARPPGTDSRPPAVSSHPSPDLRDLPAQLRPRDEELIAARMGVGLEEGPRADEAADPAPPVKWSRSKDRWAAKSRSSSNGGRDAENIPAHEAEEKGLVRRGGRSHSPPRVEVARAARPDRGSTAMLCAGAWPRRKAATRTVRQS